MMLTTIIEESLEWLKWIDYMMIFIEFWTFFFFSFKNFYCFDVKSFSAKFTVSSLQNM